MSLVNTASPLVRDSRRTRFRIAVAVSSLVAATVGVVLLATRDSGEKATARGYADNKLKGDYVIRLKGPYDIAANRQPEGAYGLTADLWAGHVEQEVGKNYGRLLQLYAVHKATKEARKKGHFVSRSAKQDGSIKLVIASA